jgi:hypothetical protein
MLHTLFCRSSIASREITWDFTGSLTREFNWELLTWGLTREFNWEFTWGHTGEFTWEITGDENAERTNIAPNAMRFMHPPEGLALSLTISMSFRKPCPVGSVSPITAHRRFYIAGALVLSAAWPLGKGPAVSPPARIHRIPPLDHGFRHPSPGRNHISVLSHALISYPSTSHFPALPLHSCPKERR